MSKSTLTSLEIMTYRRAVGSKGLTAFIERLLGELLCTNYTATVDQFENIWVTTDASSRTLFTAHTDSVHNALDPIKQEVLYDSSLRCAFKEDGRPLGADDGAGIWLLLEMIYADIPGTYVFYHGEERGGIGSSASAKAASEIYKASFDRAIAMDRAGTTDVITHQSAGRCCSDVFATALAAALGGSYEPCSSGVFTDTANLTHLIPECTNLSVGYENQHTQHETQDMEFLEDFLLPKLLTIDWEALPTERDPTKEDLEDFSWRGYGFDFYNRASKWDRYLPPEIDYEKFENPNLFIDVSDDEIETLVDTDQNAAVDTLIMLRNTLAAFYKVLGEQ
jgi:hypothetical protein